MFQNIFDTCNQVKSCTKHGRPDQFQRKQTVLKKVMNAVVPVHASIVLPKSRFSPFKSIGEGCSELGDYEIVSSGFKS